MDDCHMDKRTDGLWTRIKEKARFWYFVCSIHTTAYIMEPMEVFILNTILVAVIAMVLYTSYLFLPGHAVMIIHFLQRLMGISEPEVDMQQMVNS